MSLLGNSFGGLFGGAQQAQVDCDLARKQAQMQSAMNQYSIVNPYNIPSSAGAATIQYHYSTDSNLFTLGSAPNRIRTAVEWLEDRVNEMRVKL